MVSTNQFKNGTHIEVDGTIFKIVEFQHVKPGKGGAFVRTKLKRAADGAVIDKTFRAGEKFRPIRTETRKMQFLYSDGTDAHLMDIENYEQITVPEDSVSESLQWILPNEEVDVLYVDEEPADLQVPSAVEMAVTETEPGLRGDTASGGGDKPATLESGVERARAAVRQHRRPRARGHPLRRIRLARLAHAPHRSAARRGRGALPARRDRPPRPLTCSTARATAFTRELVEGVEPSSPSSTL